MDIEADFFRLHLFWKEYIDMWLPKIICSFNALRLPWTVLSTLYLHILWFDIDHLITYIYIQYVSFQVPNDIYNHVYINTCYFRWNVSGINHIEAGNPIV